MAGKRNANIRVHKLMGNVLDEHGIVDTETIYFYVAEHHRHAPSKRVISTLLTKGKQYERVESNKRKVTLWQRRV
jgi:hypothetical protein